MMDYKSVTTKENTIDSLIALLTDLSQKGYGDCTWYGWDDESIILEPDGLEWIVIYPR